MELLFQRKQTHAMVGGVKFKLWGKIQLDMDEESIVRKYKFDDAVLIVVDQPTLFRRSLLAGALAFVIAGAFASTELSLGVSAAVGLAAGAVVGFWYYTEKRETIFVKDLIRGRHFSCDSVVELARKEAWLTYVTSFLRQVMESAKHWDGVERHTIEALPKDEARQVIIRGL